MTDTEGAMDINTYWSGATKWKRLGTIGLVSSNTITIENEN